MKVNDQYYKIVESAISYIVANQANQPSLDDISRHVALSKFHLQRIFKTWAGVSPKTFLQFLTIEQSKQLLQLGKTTLETSYDVGLSGNGRLHDLFVKYESCTPGEFKNGGQGLTIFWDTISSPFGTAIIAETSKGICKVAFTENPIESYQALQQSYDKASFIQGLGENGVLLKSYFDTWKIPKKKISVHFKGTPFQLQVWRALLQIPSAQFCSYQDISNKIGKPKAVRAVGTAIGKNPIAYLIPCHRVIKSNGQMGNYRWNEKRKWAINSFEQARLS